MFSLIQTPQPMAQTGDGSLGVSGALDGSRSSLGETLNGFIAGLNDDHGK